MTGNIKPFYVGITENSLKKRKNDHVSCARRGSKTYCAKTIRKLIRNNRKVIIKLLSVHKNRKSLFEAEKTTIAKMKKEGIKLVNITPGGNCGPVMYGSRNPSKKLKTRNKISLANKGNKRPDLSKRNKERSSKRVMQIKKDGTIVKEYPSVREASRQTGYKFSAIYNNCLGYNKTAFNYIWRYVDDY